MPLPTKPIARTAFLVTLLVGCVPTDQPVVDGEAAEELNIQGTGYLPAPFLTPEEPAQFQELDPVAEPVQPVCLDDNHGANDAPDQATPLVGGWYGSLVACHTDWYWFDLLAGDVFSIELVLGSPDGDLDLVLVDPAGNEVVISATDGNERFQHTAETNGTYLVAVELVFDAGTPPGLEYDMTVDWRPSGCGDDQFEPNDSDLQPWPMLPGTWSDLNVCAYGDDFFGVWLEPGDELTAEIVFDVEDGDLDLTIWDPSGVWLTESATSDVLETASITAARAGYHVVWVELVEDFGEDSGTAYSLTLG